MVGGEMWILQKQSGDGALAKSFSSNGTGSIHDGHSPRGRAYAV